MIFVNRINDVFGEELPMTDSMLCKLSDEQVVELAKAGDENAYSHIITRYRNLVYKKAKAYYIKGAEEEDLIQEGMIGLYKAVQDFNPGISPFSSFAKLCVSRNMITAVKNSSRNKHMPLNSYISLNGSDDAKEECCYEIADDTNSVNPENILINRENLHGITYRINRALSKLELNVLALYLDGFSYQEIAEKLGKDAKAVDNAVQRIRKKIGKISEE